jgi:alpha-glucoside transport system substrate-binding protein
VNIDNIGTTRLQASSSRRRFLRGLVVGGAGLAGAALIGCSSSGSNATPTAAAGTASAGSTAAPKAEKLGSATVLGIWGAEELANFEAMVKPWSESTGGSVLFSGTRDLTAVLTTRVEGKNPPDIAIPAEVGLFRQFVKEKQVKSLADLGIEKDVTANYPKGFIDLATVDGKLYGFFMKADTKATIWYSPKVFKEHGWKPLTEASTFADLEKLSAQIRDAGMAPWSIGVESGGASGWAGTDWIQQILLNEAGGDVYDGVVDGSIPFTDKRMKAAWEAFGRIALGTGMTAQGGAAGINATNFKDSTFLPFEAQPKAAMVYLGGFASGFIAEQFPKLKAGEDYDFFPWPGGGVTGGANIVYAFKSNPTTSSLMGYLAGAKAQEVWVKAGGFTSANKQVPIASYPNPVSKKQAEQLANAKAFRFDLDDAIGGALQQAYFKGVTQYLQSPGQLDGILKSIEDARAA